uniref:Ubiquitinyl hydrolase 1 n=1 Tax=Panagrolaimus sp. ES5 TaxID=591445 RepID=A0AC34GQ09_9BILA
MVGVNKRYCDECGSNQNASLRNTYIDLPHVLTFTVGRTTEKGKKYCGGMTFPSFLNLNAVMSEKDGQKQPQPSIKALRIGQQETHGWEKVPRDLDVVQKILLNEGPFLYELISCAVHVGNEQQGHYYSIVKRRENFWYMCNDSNVGPYTYCLPESFEVKSGVCCLVYRRVLKVKAVIDSLIAKAAAPMPPPPTPKSVPSNKEPKLKRKSTPKEPATSSTADAANNNVSTNLPSTPATATAAELNKLNLGDNTKTPKTSRRRQPAAPTIITLSDDETNVGVSTKKVKGVTPKPSVKPATKKRPKTTNVGIMPNIPKVVEMPSDHDDEMKPMKFKANAKLNLSSTENSLSMPKMKNGRKPQKSTTRTPISKPAKAITKKIVKQKVETSNSNKIIDLSDDEITNQSTNATLIPLRQQLDERQLVEVNINPDGNCFYSSLSTVLFGNDDSHEALRNAIVEYIREHRQEYEHLLSSERQWDNYLQWQATLGSWGGQVELAAFTELYGVKVTILSEDTPPQTHGPANATHEYFIIHRNGNHYNAAIVNNNEDADDASITKNNLYPTYDIFNSAESQAAGVLPEDANDVTHKTIATFM